MKKHVRKKIILTVLSFIIVMFALNIVMSNNKINATEQIIENETLEIKYKTLDSICISWEHMSIPRRSNKV